MNGYCIECGKILKWLDKCSCKECGALLCTSCRVVLNGCADYCVFCAFEEIKTRKDELVKGRCCSACGKKVKDYTAIYCLYCGNKLKSNAKSKTGQNKNRLKNESKKNKASCDA